MTDPITTPAQMREAAARLAEKRAKYTMEAIKNATASALVSNIVTVTEAKVAHFIAAEIRALPVAEPEPLAVKVKPLVWVREDGRSEEHPKWTADVDAKRYEVFTAWWGGSDKWGFVALGQFYHTEEAAQAAAEADHAARIRSQIEAVSVAQVRAEALEDAAQAVSNRALYWWDEATAADYAGRQKLSLSYEAKALACIELAAAIRAMKGKPE